MESCQLSCHCELFTSRPETVVHLKWLIPPEERNSYLCQLMEQHLLLKEKSPAHSELFV